LEPPARTSTGGAATLTAATSSASVVAATSSRAGPPSRSVVRDARVTEVNVVLLAGGTGGAKLARGLLDEVGAGLTVIANTGDDVETYGAYVSPDPDLVTFWLADRIDERGWGLRGDTFNVMDGLRELGEDVWFNLGDRDLALCLRRARRLAEGARLTEAIDEARRALGVPARVLPMADDPVRTHIRARGRWHDFQAFMIRERGAGPVEDVEYRGADTATPTPEALAAIEGAEAVVIGPSNPVLSIWPILAVLRGAIEAAAAPVVAVSPLVRGEVLKGPTAACLEWAGVDVAEAYAGLIDGLLADEPPATRVTDVAMPDAAGRRRVAQEALALAASRDVRAAAAARRARTARAPAAGRRRDGGTPAP
jgi:LPPG:FO 2-phospho-L-lactate transferase